MSPAAGAGGEKRTAPIRIITGIMADGEPVVRMQWGPMAGVLSVTEAIGVGLDLIRVACFTQAEAAVLAELTVADALPGEVATFVQAIRDRLTAERAAAGPDLDNRIR